jgi:predicted Zn-dependent protease
MQPREYHRTERLTMLRRLTFLLFPLLFSPYLAAQNIALPEIGDPSREYLGSFEEARIGQEILQQMLRYGYVIEDPLLQQYIDSVGQKLATHAPLDSGRFTFFLVDAGSINAFALPGGYIGVHAGLILANTNESELAGVLAHETAHVTQRHIARQFAAESRMSLPMMAAMLGAALVASQAGGDSGAALAGVMAADAQRRINFTRTHESEADRVGTQLMARSGYNPEGMPDFFEKLAQNNRGLGSGVPEFLRTHPVEARRIAETRSRVDQLGKGGIRNRPEFNLAQARLEAFSASDPKALVKVLQQRLAAGSHSDAIAERYALTIALRRTRQPKLAAEEVSVLLGEQPESLWFMIEAAQIAIDTGNWETASQHLERARSLYPGDYAMVMTYGNALVQTRQPDRAMRLLRPSLKSDPLRSQAHALFARAAFEAGLTTDSYVQMAIFYELRGNLREAVFQAERALEAPDLSPHQRSKIEAQLTRLREAMEEQA